MVWWNVFGWSGGCVLVLVFDYVCLVCCGRSLVDVCVFWLGWIGVCRSGFVGYGGWWSLSWILVVVLVCWLFVYWWWCDWLFCIGLVVFVLRLVGWLVDWCGSFLFVLDCGLVIVVWCNCWWRSCCVVFVLMLGLGVWMVCIVLFWMLGRLLLVCVGVVCSCVFRWWWLWCLCFVWLLWCFLLWFYVWCWCGWWSCLGCVLVLESLVYCYVCLVSGYCCVYFRWRRWC